MANTIRWDDAPDEMIDIIINKVRDLIKHHGWTVRPFYAKAIGWVCRHPDYADL